MRKLILFYSEREGQCWNYPFMAVWSLSIILVGIYDLVADLAPEHVLTDLEIVILKTEIVLL